MLAFVMLWAYFSFSQYLIIWSGNLPRRSPGTCTGCRPAGAWSAITLIVFHFVVPFVLLLSRQVKRAARAARRRSRSACWSARLIDLFWLIAPEFHQRRHRRSAGWTSCCRWRSARSGCGCFVWQLRGRALLPVHDPQFDEALGRIIERGAPPRTAH